MLALTVTLLHSTGQARPWSLEMSYAAGAAAREGRGGPFRGGGSSFDPREGTDSTAVSRMQPSVIPCNVSDNHNVHGVMALSALMRSDVRLTVRCRHWSRGSDWLACELRPQTT